MDQLETSPASRLAYHRLEGASPGVMFLTGFKSDMSGGKALALEEFCRARGQAYLRFDYSGHGASSGKFEEGTIGAWLADSMAALDALTEGPQIIVGSSMGGWIGLLLALARPERVTGLVTLACAADFTEKLIWEKATEAQKKILLEQGQFPIPDCYGGAPYPITRALIEEGRNHLLLDKPSLPIHCPVRLIHGTADEDVPWRISSAVLEKLESKDAQLTLIKNAGHRLSEPEQLQLMCEVVGEFL